MRDAITQRPALDVSRRAPQRKSSRPLFGNRPLVAVVALASVTILFLTLPLVALIWRASGAPDFWESLRQPMVLTALRLTIISSLFCMLVAFIFGTPVAWLLARRDFRGKQIIDTIIDLPLVLPPVVAGVALLMAFGRRGLLGEHLTALGISIPFTIAAVVAAQLFIAVPFYVRGAKVGFQSVDRDVERAAAMDGASMFQTFRHVTVPLAMPGLVSGAILCWARAVSEFGATLLFAGNISGRTQTMPLAIMSAMESNLGAALALSVMMIVLSSVALLTMRLTFGGDAQR